MKNIVLIGFMGVGKGTLARALAKDLKMMAVDSDDLIESLENRSVKKIFKKRGEDYFRDKEREVANWLAKSVDNTILSTGGGFPLFVENIKEIGTVVLLHSSFDGIYKRIINSPNAKAKLKKRPLFNTYKDAEALYKKRLETYGKKADIIIDVENKTTSEIIKNLKSKL